MPTDTEQVLRYQVSAPELTDQEVLLSRPFRKAVYYYSVLWGVFNDGSVQPDPNRHGEFWNAVYELVMHFPLLVASQPNATAGHAALWLQNIQLEAERQALIMMNIFEYLLPGDMSEHSGDDESKNSLARFVECYIWYCSRKKSTLKVQAAALDSRITGAIEQLVAAKYLRTNSPASQTLNADSYMRAFAYMLENHGELQAPPAPE